MDCKGIEGLLINEKGELEITTLWGTISEQIPESYQLINGKKKLVKIQYKIIDKTTFGFTAIEAYDSSQQLVIDPVTLVWCTMLGAQGDGWGYIQDIAIDAASNVYGITGGTPLYSTTPGVYSNTLFSGQGFYVFKFNSSATALIWATYLPGSGNGGSAEAIAVDAAGNVYITGQVMSPVAGFGAYIITTPGAFDTSYNGPAGLGNSNAFVIKLNNTGSTLLYSTYLGSPAARENGYDIAIDAAGMIYVTGATSGAGFPTTAGAFDVSFNGTGPFNGTGDIFFSKINPAGAGATDLVYSTYIGGSGVETGMCMAVDASGNACISGNTNSFDFPIKAGSYDTSFNGGIDAFVCKVNPLNTGAADMVYSTFIGGAGTDLGTGIDVNGAGEAFVVGNGGAGFPVTAGAYDLTFSAVVGTPSIFAIKINSSGSSLLYSTAIDGLSGPKIALSSASCNKDEVFISSGTGTGPPITSCAYRSTPPGGGDVFLLKLKMAGSGVSDLLYSTYFGGDAQDYADIPICANARDEVFVAYTTHSTNTPTTAGVMHPNPGFANDIAVIFKMKPSAPVINYTTSISACNNTVSFAGTASGTCIWQQTWTPNYWLWDFGDGQTSNLQNPTHVFASPGTYNVKLIVGCPKDSITKTIVINPTVTVNTSFTNSSCAAGNGTGTATAIGGTPTYAYSWSNGQTSATATGLGAGTYTLTVTDASGCIGQKTITINSSGSMTASTIPANGICTGSGSATITPSGGTPTYVYSWSNGQITQTATNLITGTYTVKVTDAAGCSLTQTVSITQPAAINAVITAGKQGTCGLNNGSATVTASNGTPAYNYLWSNGQTGQTAINLPAGNYSVTVTDVNGCTSTQKAVVTTIPPVNITAVNTTNGTCGNGGTASSIATGGTLPHVYSWSGLTVTTYSVNPIPAGNYTVMVTDGNGCTSSKTFSISTTPGTASATFTQTPASTVCVGSLVNFTNTGTPPGTGISHNWLISTITPTNVSGATADFSYTFLTAGTYTVNHSVYDGTCSTSKSITVNVITCSGGPTATAVGSSVCQGSCATVTSSAAGGNAPYAYIWSNGANTQNISPCPASTTTYTVTISDSGGNTSTSTAVVTVTPSVTATTTPTNVSCNGNTNGSAVANPGGGTVPYIYVWSNGQTSQTAGNLTAGNYTVTVVDANGCTATSVTVINSPPALTGQFTKGTAACSACSCKQWIMVNANGGTSPYSYSWPDGYINRYKNQLCPGTYTINIKDKNGCSINISLNSP